MKKTLILLIVLATSLPALALPPPKCQPSNSQNRKKSRLVFRWDAPSRAYSPSPSSGMAAAVAISGAAATALRMVQEATKKPEIPVVVITPSSDCEVVLPPELNKPSAPPVIVVPADTCVTSVHVVPMEPVVKHPVPITILPMEVIKVP